MGPERPKRFQTAKELEARENALLAAARKEFPHHTFIKLLDRWIAVPAGTPVVQAADLEGVIQKLRERR